MQVISVKAQVKGSGILKVEQSFPSEATESKGKKGSQFTMNSQMVKHYLE